MNVYKEMVKIEEKQEKVAVKCHPPSSFYLGTCFSPDRIWPFLRKSCMCEYVSIILSVFWGVGVVEMGVSELFCRCVLSTSNFWTCI